MNKTIFYSLLLISFLVVLIPPVHALAGEISGEECLGGMSYMINKYYDTVGNHNSELDDWCRWRQFIGDVITESELVVLQRCVEAEATGGTLEQKANVASCILNRVRSKEWPNTISDVVFQHSGSCYQFSVIKDKRYYNVTITESTADACNYVINNGITHHGTYFCTPTCASAKPGGWHCQSLTKLFCDGEHNYYKPKKGW